MIPMRGHRQAPDGASPMTSAGWASTGGTFTGGRLLRSFYWRLRSNRRDAAHMLGVVAHGLRNAARIRKARPARRRLAVAIMTMERMGDIVAAEPIARLARQRFPDAWICWVTQAPYASVPQGFAAIDHVVPVHCLTEALLLQRLRVFDVTWNLHYNGYDCPHCCIPRNDPGVKLTQQNHYDHGNLLAVQCHCAGLPRLDDSPVVVPPPEAVAAVDALALPPRPIVIHCASVDPTRDWPADKWRELVARMLAADPTATIVEVGLQPRVIEADGPRQRALCGRLSVLETAEAIRRARLYVGIDSGPAHLAHAVGTPAVLLLGRFLTFARHMPYSGRYASGEGATVLHADGFAAELTVDEVFAAVRARLAA
jgi:heptosyltransferase-3